LVLGRSRFSPCLPRYRCNHGRHGVGLLSLAPSESTPPSAPQAGSASARRPASSRPIQQLTGQVSSDDNQYQCGQPLLQLGIMAAMPITSPRKKNHSTMPRGATWSKPGADPGAKNRNDDEERRARHKSRVRRHMVFDEIAREKDDREQITADNDGDGLKHRFTPPVQARIFFCGLLPSGQDSFL
jgi:hypothetical protein